MSLFVALLFFILTPGVFLSIPKKGSLVTKAAVHAVVFAIVYHFTHKTVLNFLYGAESFANSAQIPQVMQCVNDHIKSFDTTNIQCSVNFNRCKTIDDDYKKTWCNAVKSKCGKKWRS